MKKRTLLACFLAVLCIAANILLPPASEPGEAEPYNNFTEVEKS